MLTIALVSGLVFSAVLSIVILGGLSQNPRALIVNGPKLMQESLKALSPEELRQVNRWRIVLVLLILFAPLGIGIWYEKSYQEFNYGEAWLFLWIIWMSYNVVDLLIIDWLVLLWWQPAWSQIPDALPYSSYTDFTYHFKASLKGSLMLTVFALIGAGILMLI